MEDIRITGWDIKFTSSREDPMIEVMFGLVNGDRVRLDMPGRLAPRVAKWLLDAHEDYLMWLEDEEALRITSEFPRQFQILMLDEDNGISEEKWNLVREYLDEDIYEAVEATDSRYYLPTDWEAK